MGGLFSSWFSSNDDSEKIENEGQINNNVVIQDSVEIFNFEISLMLLIIVIIKVIEFLVFVQRVHGHRMKKKYQRSVNIQNQSNV